MKWVKENIESAIISCKDIKNAIGFYYFLHNFIYMSHPSRGFVKITEKTSYKWQRNASKLFLKHDYIISLKSRQIGFSSLVAAYALYRALFFESQNISIISIGIRESSEFLDRISFMYDKLPIWLRTPTKERAKTSITFTNNSKIKSLPNTKHAGRGGSNSLVILDEFSSFENAGDLLAAIIPSLSAGSQTKFSNIALPSQLFIISTLPSSNIDNEYIRLLHKAQDNPKESRFKIIDVNTEDIECYQSKEWLKSQEEILGPARYQREILKKEISIFDNTFIPETVLVELKETLPLRMDFLKPDNVDEEGYASNMNEFMGSSEEFDEDFGYIKNLWIWHNPIEEAQYGITADIAAGRLGDSSAIQVFDLEILEQVAEYKSNKIPLEYFKKIIYILCEYYNHALLSVERTGLGEGIASYFADGIDYDNFYYHKSRGKKVSPGFPMTLQTRPNSLVALQKLLMNKDGLKLNGIRTINELKTFCYQPNGRVEANKGYKDDLIFALAQFCYLREIFFVSDKQIQSEYNENFWKGVKKEEENIKKNSFWNVKEEFFNNKGIYNLEEIEEYINSINTKENLGISLENMKEIFNKNKI